MKILIKFPSRGRPEQFKKVFTNYVDFLSKKHDVKFVCSFDTNDSTMNNEEIKNFLNSFGNLVEYYFGDNKNKVEAMNANIGNRDFDILILASDDMVPKVKFYDDIIVEFFEKSEMGLDCMLHFHSTMWSDILDINCIMGKKYYDRFGYIYNPEYKSIFADNEYTEVSKILQRNLFIEGTELFFHDFKVGDDTERKNWEYNNEDYKVYEKRKNNNYGL